MRNILLFATALFCLAQSFAALAAGTPSPPNPLERCPVCGMFVEPYPAWVAALTLPEGKTEYFDGPRDMFIRYFALREQGVKAESYVTEYYSLRLIPAAGAYFVTGSDVTGPMGAELVPLATKEEAAGFLKDHQGKAALAFGEVTPATMKQE